MKPNQMQFPMPGDEQQAAWKYDFVRQSNADQGMADNPKTEDFQKKMSENEREVDTRNAMREDTVKDLQDKAKRGNYTEISGDAIARLKADMGPKLHKD